MKKYHESKGLHEILWRLVNKLDTNRGRIQFHLRVELDRQGGIREHEQVKFKRERNGEKIKKMTFPAFISLS